MRDNSYSLMSVSHIVSFKNFIFIEIHEYGILVMKFIIWIKRHFKVLIYFYFNPKKWVNYPILIVRVWNKIFSHIEYSFFFLIFSKLIGFFLLNFRNTSIENLLWFFFQGVLIYPVKSLINTFMCKICI